LVNVFFRFGMFGPRKIWQPWWKCDWTREKECKCLTRCQIALLRWEGGEMKKVMPSVHQT
jgi:hypothetical protein